VVEKAQQDPHCYWFLIGVTTAGLLAVLQSTEEGVDETST